MYLPHVSFESEKNMDPKPSNAVRRPAVPNPRVGLGTQTPALLDSNSSRTSPPSSGKRPTWEGTTQPATVETRQRPDYVQSEQLGTPRAVAPFIRRIVFRHDGFGDIFDPATRSEEEEYVNNNGRLRVEEAYDPRKVDDMKKELEDFWKGRGIAVQVNTNLTQIPTAPRYAILEIDVYRK
jgi:hypothetical protein